MKPQTLIPRLHILPLAFAFGLLLSSCSLIGGYNARAHEHLTGLKAAHIKVIDDDTAAEGKSYSATKLEQQCDALELRFREAETYAGTLGDNLRTENLALLHGVFREDAGNMRRKARLLSADQAQTLNDATNQAYDQALKGELVRPGAPAKKDN